MGSQSDTKVLFDLLAASNNKNALLEIEIAKLKSVIDSAPKSEINTNLISQSTIDDLQKQLDLANKKILFLSNIHEKNTKKFISMKETFENELLKYKDSKKKIKELKRSKKYLLENLFDDFNLIPIELLHSTEHETEVDVIIEDSDFYKLLNYKSFRLEKMNEHFFIESDYEIFTHVIDNCLDINVECKNLPFKYLIFFVLARCDPDLDLIKYLIDKKINLEVEYSNKSTPINFACQKSSFDVIDLILDQDVKLGFKNSNGMTQSDYLKQNSNLCADEKQTLMEKIDFIISSRKTDA